MLNTLLKTKLYIPQVRPQLVPRPRLIERLNKGLGQNRDFGRKLTVISAPAGFGKTTLLSEWINEGVEAGDWQLDSSGLHRSPGANRQSLQFVWVSLDEYDNDPVRFWTYVIGALETVQTDLGSDALTLLHAPQAPPIETTLTALINAITEASDKIVLILDDYHVIETEAIHQALTFLLDHLPPQMHLVMTSRTEPPLPLTRLRVRGQLTELVNNDLRFTPPEVATFLNQIMGLDLSPDDVAALEARTEGWIAGLQLAALAIQSPLSAPRGNAQNFVRAFTGSHHYVIDYLAEEVLARQPEHIQTFLLETSILGRLYGPLCDAVINRTMPVDLPKPEHNREITPAPFSPGTSTPPPPLPGQSGQEILNYLDHANLFLIPLDDERRWYRYHHLFADFLQEHLQQSIGREGMAALHRRACAWYANNNFAAEAVSHALAAGNIEQATKLVEQLTIPLLTQGEVTILMGWLEQLPEEVVRTSPRLILGQAWALIIMDKSIDFESLLQNAEKALNAPAIHQDWSETEIQSMWGEVASIRAMKVAVNKGEVEQSITLGRQALEQLPKDEFLIRSILTMNLGFAYRMAGNLDLAGQRLTEAIALSQQTAGNIVVAMYSSHSRAMIEEEVGRLRQAIEYHRQALQFVTKQDNRGRETILPIAGLAYLGIAEILREWNDLETAKEYLLTGIKLGRQGNQNSIVYVGHIILARTLQALGDEAGALESIQTAKASPSTMFEKDFWVDAVQARLRLIQGDLAAATQWAQTSGLPLGDDFNYIEFPGEYSTLVRVYIAQERFEEADGLLQRMLTAAETAGRWGRVIEIVMLQALLRYALGNPEQALAPLTRALSLAEPENYVRVFVDEGPPMAQLLNLARSRRVPHLAYIDKLLAAFDFGLPPSTRVATQSKTGTERSRSIQNLKSEIIEPLSERELEVLGLIATGLSNREIAEKLFITVGTAKTHANNIYRKLDVRSRTQAVARATELGVL